MASWGNQQNQPYPQDMDSNGNKLKVRNTSGTYTESLWRVDIEETGETRQALQVKGITWLEHRNDVNPSVAVALTVKGKTTMGSWDAEHRPQPVLSAGGRTELNAYPDQQGQPAEYALKVTGRASFARQMSNDLMAVKVDGDVRIKLGQTTPQPPDPPYENTCAVLRPQTGVTFGRPDITDIAQFQLLINGNRDDRPNPPPNPEGTDAPHVKIGWKDGDHGNVVAIRPRKLLLGSAPWQLVDNDIYRIKAKGSMRIEPENPANVALDVDGKVVARHVDGKPWVSETLPDIPTHVMGPLKVVQASDLQGEVLIRGNITAQSPLLAQNDATVLGNLVVDGNITVQGVLSAVTAPRIIGTGTVISQGSVECLGVASLKEEGCFHYVPASVRSDRGDVSTLAVEHLRQENRDAALHVVNNSILPEGTGGYFRAPRAIVAEGEVQINGRTVLNGEAVHASPVLMQSQPIIMGGEGSDEVKMVCGNRRLEFYIDNKLRFYIDENGGHNA